MSPNNRKKHGKSKSAKITPTSDNMAHQPTTTPASANNIGSESPSEHTPIVTTTQPTAPISSTTESVSTIDFEFFLENASFFDIQHFLHEISQSTQSANLRRLWKRAFHEGRRQGFQDGLISRDEIDIDTLFDKYFEGGRKEGRKEGEEFGQQTERQVWLSAGHGAGECTPTPNQSLSTSTATQTEAAIPVESSTQTEPLDAATISISIQTSPPHSDISTQILTDFNSSDPCHINTVVQAVEPPPPAIPPQTASPHLNWAEDAESLPTCQLQTGPSRQPRDLSVLRPSSASPFSSLHRRSKMRNAHQSRCRHHRPFYSEFPDPPPHRHPLYPCSKPETQKPKHRPPQRAPSNLDWDSDPRLYDLSRSLKALGWFRVP